MHDPFNSTAVPSNDSAIRLKAQLRFEMELPFGKRQISAFKNPDSFESEVLGFIESAIQLKAT